MHGLPPVLDDLDQLVQVACAVETIAQLRRQFGERAQAAGDAEDPPLRVVTLDESESRVAVAAGHPLAGQPTVQLEQLEGLAWIAGRPTADGVLLGVWPGLARRQRVVHTAQDWLTKLALVAAGLGATTVPPLLAPALPPGVAPAAGGRGPRQVRRLLLARPPGPARPGVVDLEGALRDAESGNAAARPRSG